MNPFVYRENEFEGRHLGPSQHEIAEMLQVVGAETIAQLIAETVPSNIRLQKDMQLPAPVSEHALLSILEEKAGLNKNYRSLIGLGYYDTITPGVILRNIMENPGWYTQYTPYQAEIAQGRLEALLNYQTLVTDLTGMEIANASLLDEATAAAEAMAMFFGIKTADQGNKFFVSENCYPQTIAVLATRAEPLSIELVIGSENDIQLSNAYFGALLQYPNRFGNTEVLKSLVNQAKLHNIKIAVSADLLSLLILEKPGKWGADVVVGSSQRFGVPMGYGGPHAAFFATLNDYKRHMPGRIIGVSVDAKGNKAYRMALQTREQHIRREKATSNICTAQVLLAIMASMYAVYHGPKGLFNISISVYSHTLLLKKALETMGIQVTNATCFDTLTIATGTEKSNLIASLADKHQYNFNYTVEGKVSIALDEKSNINEIISILNIFKAVYNVELPDLKSIETEVLNHIRTIQPKNDILTHPVFNSYQSEHEMLRYIKRLEAKDLSLTHSMIALGSCTMKLNATTEMIPVTWKGFNNLHPFAPLEQTKGYQSIFAELEDYLAAITGFDGVSLQPNAGAQGEYAGLMVIRAYLKSKGESHRNIAIIPSSAHGTNPASAVMAGMHVVVTKCDEMGNIDLVDLKEKVLLHKDALACLMVTYPSTHGVFESEITAICSLIHAYGGQVYMDGANMNAQVGLTSPAMIGADVCHLNLHKTFCIPHGGGGPGMGPICVAKHLTPFLPGHPLIKTGGLNAMSAISAAPWGSASILLISYAYIRLMGADGLRKATELAILNANYIKNRLEKAVPILYAGTNGRCAHEMILDTRVFKAETGVEVEDIAKRLMDYGFHAPTVSFPVAGTLMIEPTESESKAELDRFCEAMLSIFAEIGEIAQGNADKTENVLKNAPHTAKEVTKNDWNMPYSREKAAFPLPWVVTNKFWPSVSRINNTYGDRNLICTCPPIEEYEIA